MVNRECLKKETKNFGNPTFISLPLVSMGSRRAPMAPKRQIVPYEDTAR